jgi:transposase InsO family protein
MGMGDVVAWDLSLSPNLEQTKRMLDEAFTKHPDLEGLILHSDMGWQYQHGYYQQRLKEKGIVQSMSRKGNCLDNSPMENFFGVMKNEMFYGHSWKGTSIHDFIETVDQYIHWYAEKRIKMSLGGLSPLDYRRKLGLVP